LYKGKGVTVVGIPGYFTFPPKAQGVDHKTFKADLSLRVKTQELKDFYDSLSRADTILIATDPTKFGDLLAEQYHNLLRKKFPNAAIRRLRLVELSSQSYSEDFGDSSAELRRKTATRMLSWGYSNYFLQRLDKNFEIYWDELVLLHVMEKLSQRKWRVALDFDGVKYHRSFSNREATVSRISSSLAKAALRFEDPQETFIDPPTLIDLPTVIRYCACQGMQPVEVLHSLRLLYNNGWLSHYDIASVADDKRVKQARTTLELFLGKTYVSDDVRDVCGIIPTDVQRFTSSLRNAGTREKQVYQVVWSAFMAAFAIPTAITYVPATLGKIKLHFAQIQEPGFLRIARFITVPYLFVNPSKTGCKAVVETRQMYSERDVFKAADMPFERVAWLLSYLRKKEYIDDELQLTDKANVAVALARNLVPKIFSKKLRAEIENGKPEALVRCRSLVETMKDVTKSSTFFTGDCSCGHVTELNFKNGFVACCPHCGSESEVNTTKLL